MLNPDCLYHIISQLSDITEFNKLKCIDKKWNEWLDKKEAMRECTRWSPVFDSIKIRFCKYYKLFLSQMQKNSTSDIGMYTSIYNLFSYMEDNIIIMKIFNYPLLWKVICNKLKELESVNHISPQRRFYYDLLIVKFKPLKDRIYFNHLPRHPVYGIMQYPQYFEDISSCIKYMGYAYEDTTYNELLESPYLITSYIFNKCWKSCFGDYYDRSNVNIISKDELVYLLLTIEASDELKPL